jgi:hypothetical protein
MLLAVSNLFSSITNKMQRYIIRLFLQYALHVSERFLCPSSGAKKLYIQHRVFVKPILLPFAIVVELGQSQLYVQCFELLMMGGGTA